MSLINTGSFSKALWPGVNRWYGKEYNDYGTEYDKIFDVRKSNRNFEEEVGISSFGLAIQKPEGSPIQYDSERQGFISRYQHVVFALGFIITREVMDDEILTFARGITSDWLEAAVTWTSQLYGFTQTAPRFALNAAPPQS